MMDVILPKGTSTHVLYHMRHSCILIKRQQYTVAVVKQAKRPIVNPSGNLWLLGKLVIP